MRETQLQKHQDEQKGQRSIRVVLLNLLRRFHQRRVPGTEPKEEKVVAYYNRQLDEYYCVHCASMYDTLKLEPVNHDELVNACEDGQDVCYHCDTECILAANYLERQQYGD